MVFARGERNRAADRARIAPLGGHVGRNLGDQPYIMDVVLQWHFLGGAAPNGFAFTTTGGGVPIGRGVTGATIRRLETASVASSTIFECFDTSGATLVNMAGYNRDASLRARARWSAVDSAAKVFLGLSTSAALASNADGLFFGINGAVSTTYFVCVSRKDGVATTAILDGGGTKAEKAIDTNFHDVSIICDSTAGEVRFYVDRQVAASITTDLPSDSDDYFTPLWSAENGATAAQRYIDLDVILVAEAAP